MARRIYISVILPLKLEWEPYYALPQTGEGTDTEAGAATGIEIQVGERVKVLFAGRTYIGVVSGTDVAPKIEESRIVEILEVERNLEIIRPEEIELWRMIAGYYMCSVGEVYKMAYPIVKTNQEVARAAALERTLASHEKILVSMRSRIERIKERIDNNKAKLETAKEGTKKRATIEAVIEKATKELGAAETALAEAEIHHKSIGTDSLYWKHAPETSHQVELTPSQEEAYNQIDKSIREGKPALLHGVTGSGKTEIYIRLAKNAIAKGRNVLYLVPEIALSRQLTERLQAYFSESLITFHSAETLASKRNTAEKIRAIGRMSGCSLAMKGTCRTINNTDQGTNGTGQTGDELEINNTGQTARNYIVLGTRSSLFLPHNNLGLIIVDEEHDSSYKQDSPAPRYNGRDTALMLSTIHRCGIVLGSATPSLEELYNCECGRHTLVTLTERYHGDSQTQIEIIDTKAERKKRGMEGCFSRKMIEHIRRTIAEGGQVMILRSRRAWASSMQCEECGEIQKCPHCNVSLSLHKTGNTEFLSCHYCGHRESYRTTCTKCNGTIKPLGSGTQKIEEEAAILFPEARIARLDSDTAQKSGYETKVIKEFAKGEIDILVGTQILTKGFDFSNLRLTAVIAADTMLGIQDFRADEKAMQLLEQFKGRCGRRGNKGLFVIQTSQPEHPIYQRITEGETKIFSDTLLAERKTFDFPPYSRIIEITIRDKNQKRADLMISRLAATLRQVYKIQQGQGLLAASPVTGPYSPVVDKVQEEYIRCIRISLRKDRTLAAKKAVLNETVCNFEKDQKYTGHITLNVDPA